MALVHTIGAKGKIEEFAHILRQILETSDWNLLRFPILTYLSLKIRSGMIFAYSHQNHMVFLYSDGKKKAVKYNIKTGSHRKMKSSTNNLYQSPESFDVGYNRYHIGLRVGNYFWIIFGGLGPLLQHQVWDEQELYDPNLRTLFWSIKKEKWFRGPDLPDFLNSDFKEMCSISAGMNTAFVMNRKYTYSFDLEKKIGQYHKSPPALLDQGNGYSFESCVLHLQKDYRRYIIHDHTIQYYSWESF